MPSKAESLLAQVCGGSKYQTIQYRKPEDLPFITDAYDFTAPILLDTGVYIQTLKGQLCPLMTRLLSVNKTIYHSSVAISEVIVGAAALDPTHPNTPKNREVMLSAINIIPETRILTPSNDDWMMAAAIAGRVGLQRKNYKAVLADALIYVQAAANGLTLVSANSNDFDLINQISPGKLLLFRPAA